MTGQDEKIFVSALDKQEGGDHYLDLDPQPASVLRCWRVSHLEGEVIYRTLRHQNKNGREDILKAIHTLQLILELDYTDASENINPRDGD